MAPALLIPFLSWGSLWGLGDTPKVPAVAQSAVVVIRTSAGGGSGFLALIDGKKYIVTNQHVLMGAAAADVHITFTDGTEAHPTKPEIVGDRDLARLEIETDRTPLKCAAGSPEIGTRVLAIGNSLDAGVITCGGGQILGVGATDIEVDCDFVPGNSGGPILDPLDNVLGVATYIRMGENNPTTAGTRYAKNRRFATRLHDGMPWITIPQWPAYAAAGAAIHDTQGLGEEVYLAAQAIATNADLSLFKPKTQKVVSAIGDFDRLKSQLAKLSANGLTQRELQSNRAALAATYRGAFQKLLEACTAASRDLGNRPIPPAWGWLNEQRKTTLQSIQALQGALEAEIKKEPPF